MSTTGMVITVTDELLAELEEAANPATITALTAELRRLRAENAELGQSLAESRANDQAAMGWLTSLRWASGDRGERMLPELVSHIEGLAKDAGRYRWLRDDAQNCPVECPVIVIADEFASNVSNDLVFGAELDTAIDTAMATQ